MGTKLFERTTRRVDLTEAGLRLIAAAEEALAASGACIRAARGETAPPTLELLIGTRHELGLSWLLPVLELLEREQPSLSLNLYFGSGPDLELRVRSAEIDCAVSSRRIEDPRVEGLPLQREDYVFVAHPKLLEKTPLETVAQAIDHTLIDVHATLPLFSYWRGAAPDGDGVRFGHVRSLGTIGAARWMILRRKGVGVLPLYHVQRDLKRGTLVRVLTDVEPQFDTFRLLIRRNDPRRARFEALAAILRDQPLK